MKLAVTGANGFVGRHVLRAAREAGVASVAVVRSEAAEAAVAGWAAEVRRIPSLHDPGLAGAVSGASALVHLAQIGAERGGARYDAVNVAGTRAVTEACRASGVARVVYFSGLGVAHYGQSRRCTNAYFLSKLEAELVLFRSGLDVRVFRPSYVLGPGGELVPELVRELREGAVEWIGEGRHRMQPIDVRDAAALVLAAAGGGAGRAASSGVSAGTGVEAPAGPHRVFDLVGPDPVSYAGFVERVAAAAQARGVGGQWRARSVSAADADAQAVAGGYRGMLPDELDCLLCDEVSGSGPLERLLGRPLRGLDEAICVAVDAALEP